jgi:hypothetical protein
VSARLRYSDRKVLAETGTLGDLHHEQVPDTLATAIRSLIETASPPAGRQLQDGIQNELIQHFGVGQRWFSFYFGGPDVDAFLDAVEILAEIATSPDYAVPIPDIEDRINALFIRHRFGYRIEAGEIRKIGSPALEEVVVGPALLAVQRPGWDEVERSYREAILRQRGGETDDAITAANAAVEAALKAIGMKGKTLGELAKSFRDSGLVPGYLTGVPELLDDLLDRLNASRSTHGDAHGKAPGAVEVPQALADLAVHWAGSFLVYLAETVPE